MAHSTTLPFFAFKIRLSEDNYLQIPLLDSQALRLNEPVHLLAGKYANAFQEKVLNKGNFEVVMQEYIGDQYESAIVSIDFKKAKDRVSYPDFELEFTYYYTEQELGMWGIVPMLGMDSFGEDLEALEKNLTESIRLDFLRNNRLKWIREIIVTIWEEEIELNQEAISLQFPTLKELEGLKNNSNEQWLPKVAKRIYIDRQVVYGRAKALDQLTQALKGKFTRNVLLVGASGVGKTALVWEVVYQQQKRNIKGEFWETTASTLIKELTTDSSWQHNLPYVIQEIVKKGAILYVNNLMELFEVGRSDGNSVGIAEYLLPYISRGEITLLSECSEEELARIELNNPNYLSAFQVIRITTPQKNIEDIIIKKVKDLAASRSIDIHKEAIQETLRLNKRFTPYSGLPGKPIRFLESILINAKNIQEDKISRSSVIRAFCEETGMPLFMVDPSIPMDVEKTRATFNNNVFGQEQAVNSIVNVLSSVKTALTHIGKPIASFLFVGPTGVGKTELAKVLAQFMFGNRNKMVRFDMSEYADPYSVTRLTGLGPQSDGLLTSAIQQEPFSVLLFDEIEKAHPNFYDLLLQVLSEGRLTSSRGKLVNFCSTIIIMTSNIGASNLQGNRISLRKEQDAEEVTTHFLSAVQKFFRPELYNRIEEVVPFAPLSSETIRLVVQREIELFKRLEGIKYRALTIQIAEEVLAYLVEKGYHPQYGARQLQRAIRSYLIIPLAKELNVYDDQDQLEVAVTIHNEQLQVTVECDPLGFELMMEETQRINQTDGVSDQRRDVQRLQEGSLYIRLLNEIVSLERLKKRKPKQFWNNAQQADFYTHLLQLKERLNRLVTDIEQLEESLALSYLGVQPYSDELEAQEKNCKQQLTTFKIDLCSRLQPNYNHCWIGLFGRSPLVQFELYKQILKELKIPYTFKTIWYRQSLYEESLTLTELEEEAGKITDEPQKKAYAHIPEAAPYKDKFKPPKKGDELVGIIFHLQYPCIYLMFQKEAGRHLWQTDNKKEQSIDIAISTQSIIPPYNIHRKELYGPPYRWVYQWEKLIDKELKQTYLVQKTNYLPKLLPYFEATFLRNLEAEVL